VLKDERPMEKKAVTHQSACANQSTHQKSDLEKKGQSLHRLCQVLADTYVVYLKTQNYHWNVVGENFYSLHLLFEKQYQELADAVDEVAERIRALGSLAPATFEEYAALTHLKSTGTPSASDGSGRAEQMLVNLGNDHKIIIDYLKESVSVLEQTMDPGTVDLLTERLRAHEKMAWFLKSSLPQIPEVGGERGETDHRKPTERQTHST